MIRNSTFVLTLEWFQNDLQITIEDFDWSCVVHAGQMIELFSMVNIHLASFKKSTSFLNKVYPLSLVIQTISNVFEHFPSIDRELRNSSKEEFQVEFHSATGVQLPHINKKRKNVS